MHTERSSPASLRPHRRREGSVAITVVILLGIILGCAALIVDVGQIYRVRGELQNAADAAALAAAQALDGTSAGITAATAVVQTFGSAHEAENAAMDFTNDMAVEFGHWYFAGDATATCSPTPCFDSYGAIPATPMTATAVRVTALRTAGASNAVNHFFAPILGISASNVQADAVALGGGPAEAECAFPLVVPDCQVATAATNGTCGWCMVFAASPSDTAGWTSFAASGGCGGPDIDAKVIAACGAAGELVQGGACTTCTQESEVNDTIQVCNGNNMNKNNFCGTIQAILQRDGVDADANGVVDGTAFQVQVPVLDTNLTPATCGTFNFSSTHTMSGFATVTIYGVRCGNPEPLVVDPNFAGEPCQAAANKDVILAKLECDNTVIAPAGGGAFGTDATHTRLVE